ncbi:MAG: hypothetical protein CMI00_11500 [Oceanospirillaceae bacterium]|nr:hypothetical protein [Oceanospirillaceae bacterium]|tara:strand:- start:4858 stop:6330 length:1473 start_codon:yes stop_codon:yes gene_type:complete
MHPENILIPFQPSELPEGSWMVFAPHPDDEVIGMGGALLKAQAAGCQITLVFMTSGDQGGVSTEREAEASAVATKLGAEAVFMRFPDRGVKAGDEAQAQVKALIQKTSPDCIFFPSPQEYHPDHRMTAALVFAAQKLAGFSGQLYHYDISRQSEANHLVDISSQSAAKAELLNLYTSQLGQNNYVAVMEALNIARTYTLPKGVERAEAFYLYGSHQNDLLGTLKERAFQCLNDPLPSDSPTISVLIRTKDRHDLLRRALKSVQQQKYSGSIDVVVINDGGETVEEVLAEFRKHFWRLHSIDLPESRGRAAAANLAMSQSRGMFLNFLDDDDELHPNHLAVFIAQWRRHRETEVFYSGVRVVDKDGKKINVYKESYDRGRLLYLNYLPIHAVTFHRRFVETGHRFDESLEFFEDWDFWIQLSRQTKFYFSKEVTATYHMIGSSAASSHMTATMDPVYHLNKVRQKWMQKCTPNEWNASLNWIRQEARNGGE